MKPIRSLPSPLSVLKIAFAFILITICSFIGCNVAHGETRDSIACRDSVQRIVTSRETTFKVCNTFKVPIVEQLVRAHYDNQISIWYFSASGQDAMIKWHLSNGDNRIYLYDVDGMIGNTANWKWIARFNDSCSAKNIETYFVWSNPTSVTVLLDKFTKAQIRPSAKFDGLKSELEPYNNTVSYILFWEYSRKVHKWAMENGVPSMCYIGWHTQQSYDSLVVLYDAIDLHVYVSSTNMLSSTWLYNYSKVRLGMIASPLERDHKTGYPIGIIFSDETAFGFQYYVNNKCNLLAPYNTYTVGYYALTNGASALIKNTIKLIGFTTFTSSYTLKIKPLPTPIFSFLRVANVPRPRKVLYVNPETKLSEINEIAR